MTVDSKAFYFKNGISQTGWQTISGKKYYYLPNGGKHTGTKTIDGKSYFFLDSGALAEGWVTLGGKKYYFRNNQKVTGKQTISGSVYYFDDNGVIHSGWEMIGGNKYYYGSNGATVKGWKTIGGNKYYFDAEGVMQKNTDIGIYHLGSDGVAKKSSCKASNLNAFLDFILSENGRSPNAIFSATRSTLTYKYKPEGSSHEARAIEAINTGRGACWHFASLAHLLYQRAGYQSYYVSGLSHRGNEHRWLYVKFSDGWYYVDPTYSDGFKLTEEQLVSKGYKWNASSLPAN